jgi:hypothetical protein
MQCLHDYDDDLDFDQLRWCLLKLCSGFDTNKIRVFELKGKKVEEKILALYPGRTKSDKIEFLINVRTELDDVFIVSPNNEFHF